MVDHEHCSRRPLERRHPNIPRNRVVPVTDRCRTEVLKVSQSGLSGEFLAADFLLVDRALTIEIVKIGRNGQERRESEVTLVDVRMRAERIVLMVPRIAPDRRTGTQPTHRANNEQADDQNGGR